MDTHNATQKQEDISRASAFASRRNLLAIAVAGLDGLLGSSAASAAPASRGQSLHEINVKNFGARGDGRTDETAAFQRALDSVHIVVVRFVNSAFWGPCNQIAKTAGRGTIGFRDCTLIQWKKDRAAIQAFSGSVLIRGCEFRQNQPHILLGENVARAIISGNLFTGAAQIQNTSTKDVQIGRRALNTAHGNNAMRMDA